MVRDAILNKLQIIAMYHGHVRELCPHLIGWKHGDPHALFYQFGGQSSRVLDAPGSPANWRCIRIRELTHVAVRKGPWYTATNYSRPERCVDEVDLEVSR